MRRLPIWKVLLILICTNVATQAQATPLIIPAGIDFLSTEPGTVAPVGPFPQGFFGEKGGVLSDPIAELEIAFEGLPLVTTPIPALLPSFQLESQCHSGGISPGGNNIQHCVGGTGPVPRPLSTAIERGGPAVLNAIGDTAIVDIKIVELQQLSISPLTVTYGGGLPSFYDIMIDLNPMVEQKTGSLKLIRTGETSGLMDTILPVDFRLHIVGGPNDPKPVEEFLTGFDELTSIGEIDGNSWFIVPEPSTALLFGTGVIGLVSVLRRRDLRTAN